MPDSSGSGWARRPNPRTGGSSVGSPPIRWCDGLVKVQEPEGCGWRKLANPERGLSPAVEVFRLIEERKKNIADDDDYDIFTYT